jgi:NADPH-dependent 2,4-dienoyl-CoA reductase/sulfur reductase-like enzyme
LAKIPPWNILKVVAITLRDHKERPMNVADERSRSCWIEDAPAINSSALRNDETCDVVVIGSGIAGLSTAYELCRFGRSVIVIDRGKIGRGMTARTTAHLASELDDFYSELIRVRGEDEARLLR